MGGREKMSCGRVCFACASKGWALLSQKKDINNKHAINRSHSSVSFIRALTLEIFINSECFKGVNH